MQSRKYLEAFAEYARHCDVAKPCAIAIKGATLAVNECNLTALRDWAIYLLDESEDWRGDTARECKDALCKLINEDASQQYLHLVHA